MNFGELVLSGTCKGWVCKLKDEKRWKKKDAKAKCLTRALKACSCKYCFASCTCAPPNHVPYNQTELLNSPQTVVAQPELKRQQYWSRDKIRTFTGEIDVDRFQSRYTEISVGQWGGGFRILTHCNKNCRGRTSTHSCVHILSQEGPHCQKLVGLIKYLKYKPFTFHHLIITGSLKWRGAQVEIFSAYMT